MDDISRYYLVLTTFGAVLAIVVTFLAIRAARGAKPSRPGFDADSPDPELVDQFGDEGTEEEDDPELEGPTAATEHLVPAAPPRVGLSALADADPSFSEPELLADLHSLFAAAWMARGAGDLGPLNRRFSEGAAEAMLGGRGPLGAVRLVLVDAPRVLDAAVEEPWARATVAFTALVNAVWDGAARDFLVEERWAVARPAAGGSPWTVRQVLDREQAPLSRPPLERGREVEPGTSLPTVRQPDLAARRDALLARHPTLDLDALLGWVPELYARVQAALDAEDPGALGELMTQDRLAAFELAQTRLARVGLRERRVDPEVLQVELCRVDGDAKTDRLTLRVRARCRQWLADQSGAVVDGVADEPRTYSEYWTFLRPAAGDPPFARGRQGFALWRIEADEAYNG